MDAPSQAGALLRNLGAHPAVTVTIRVGNEHWEYGDIGVAVRGDGEVEVDQRRAGRPARSFRARLDAARVDAFGALLATHRFTELRDPGKPRQPDDAPVSFGLTRDGQALHRAALWEADRFEDTDLNEILKAYDALAGEVSGGVLPYGPGSLD